MPAEYEILLRREKCKGKKECMGIFPETFTGLDKDKKVVMKTAKVAAKDLEKAILASRACPTRALTILNQGKRLAP